MASDKTINLMEAFLEQVDIGLDQEWKGIVLFSTWYALQNARVEFAEYLKGTYLSPSFNKRLMTWSFPNGETLWLKHLSVPETYYELHGHRFPFLWRYEKHVWPLSNKKLSARLDTLSGSPNRKIRLINR